jgi:hypothetical protein
MDMGMAATDKDQILCYRNRMLHRLFMPQRRPEDELLGCADSGSRQAANAAPASHFRIRSRIHA